MAKLYFRYGAVGASKTANALMVAYNYEEKGLTPLVLKPQIENRDGANILKSRIGLKRECGFVEDVISPEGWDKTKEYFNSHNTDVVIIDECQFMTPMQVRQLWNVVNELKIPVICYGLSTDFQQNLFPASAELMKLADKVEEIKTICWCGDGAKCNARLDLKGNVVRTGSQIQMGGTEPGLPSYTSLCTKHFIEGDIGPKMRAKFQQREEAAKPTYDVYERKNGGFNLHTILRNKEQVEEFCSTVGKYFVSECGRRDLLEDIEKKGVSNRIWDVSYNLVSKIPDKYKKIPKEIKLSEILSEDKKWAIRKCVENYLDTKTDWYRWEELGMMSCNEITYMHMDGSGEKLHGMLDSDSNPIVKDDNGEIVFRLNRGLDDLAITENEIEEIEG